jgi:hypothetical protein
LLLLLFDFKPEATCASNVISRSLLNDLSRNEERRVLPVEPKRSDFCLFNDVSRDKTVVVLLLCDLVKLASRDDSLELFLLRNVESLLKTRLLI